MTALHLAALTAQIRTVASLHAEHQELLRVNAELRQRDQVLRAKNQLLAERGEELADTLQQLKRAQNELVHQERLTAVGQLAAGIAHEVNNPASYVISNLDEVGELCEQHMPARKQPQARQIVADAQHGLQHIVDIMQELSAFSRSDRNEKKEVSISSLLQGVQRLLSNELRHRATLTIDEEPQLVVYGVRRRLTQVLLNLVINALHAMPQERDVKENQVFIRARHSGNNVLVEVTDNGRGVPEELQAKILEPFFTTKTESGGTGLGLSIASEIIHQHDGTLAIESVPGEGTTFQILLPQSQPLSDRPTKISTLGFRPRALLVDDEPRVLRAHQRQLREHFEIVPANGGPEALSRLRDDPDYDLVFCDLMMPKVNGLEVWKRISEEKPRYRKKFIFVSGGVSRSDLREALEASGRPVAEKPINPDVIKDLAIDVLEVQNEYEEEPDTVTIPALASASPEVTA